MSTNTDIPQLHLFFLLLPLKQALLIPTKSPIFLAKLETETIVVFVLL